MAKPRLWMVRRRKELRMTQETFARRAGRKLRTVLRWEKGETFPSYEDQKDIALALKFDIDYVVARFTEEQSHPVVVDKPTSANDEAHEDCQETARFVRRVAMSFAHEMTLEELDESIVHLARCYVSQPLNMLVTEIRDVKRQAFALLEANRHPDQMRQLYLVASRACGLQTHVALDLGNYVAAESQARNAWTLADLSGHNGARSWVRSVQSLIAYWDGRHQEAAEFARSGQLYAIGDSTAVRLPSLEARACAAWGDKDGAISALEKADRILQRGSNSSIELGGLFTFPEGKQAAYAGTTRLTLNLPEQVTLAVQESKRAIDCYAHAGAQDQSTGDILAARFDLASAHVMNGELDGALQELGLIQQTPLERRTASLRKRARALQSRLKDKQHKRSKVGRQVLESAEAFCLTGRARK